MSGWRGLSVRLGSRFESGRFKFGPRQQSVIEEVETLDAVDRSHTIDEDEHVAGCSDLAVGIIAGLRRRLNASNLIDRDERPLDLFNAAEDVLEVEIRPLPAIVDGFLLDGHVAAEFGEVFARLEIVGLKGCFDVAIVSN